MTQQLGGFSGTERSFMGEEELHLISVGVDIGSSTSHLVFSELELERRNTRYVIVKRTILRESEILLTPYTEDGTTIDAHALGAFINNQYILANLKRDQIDTGALILTGVAVQRHNARSIAEIFAEEAGRFVAVSAGDGLEATMAAHGSGAVEESEKISGVVMNIDIGGGTSKITICQQGKALEVTAIDVGARVLAFDEDGKITRIEESGKFFAREAGVEVAIGASISIEQREAIVQKMMDRLREVIALGGVSEGTKKLLRLPELTFRGKIDTVIFSGGVSEFIYGRESSNFGDLGPIIASAVRKEIVDIGAMIMVPNAGIRATVVGASQYTVQVSGSTILISPLDAVPLRNIPVMTPDYALNPDADIDRKTVSDATKIALARLDLLDANTPIAVSFAWQGSATFARLDAFTRGVVDGMGGIIDSGNPIVLVSDGDIGGLLGLHLVEEVKFPNPVISIDGIELREFDYIDIGELIQSSGAVPVVIKSLVFPGSTQRLE
ncbi:MAG: ethanolamine utilization protein EutA [Chloroflexi bacterium]|nr:ethanolamine utilization protein EutA [Chloroflexota bacterium]